MRRKFWEIRDMKGYGRYWRVTCMGNTGISRGMGNKGKSPSHLHFSFPTKKLPSTLPPPRTGYIILLCLAKKPPDKRNQAKENQTKLTKHKTNKTLIPIHKILYWLSYNLTKMRSNKFIYLSILYLSNTSL